MTTGSERVFFSIFWTILIFASWTKSLEIRQNVSANIEESSTRSSTTNLRMEARGDSDGLDVDSMEIKSKNSEANFGKEKIGKGPMILGTSKVAIVYSEKKSATPEKDKNAKSPRVVYPQKSSPGSNQDRNWRVIKVSSRDSYLDALEHSQTSKDPREGVISNDSKPKVSKLIRRDYSEGPVYRHPHEDYKNQKESFSSYNTQPDVANRLKTTKNNVARISYGGPTPEPFFPTPSDSYSLPIQSSVNFNNNNNDNNDSQGFYGSPQISYGSPQTSYGSPQTSYGSPSPQTQIYASSNNNNFNRIQSIPQNVYGPPNNGYPSSGTPHQAYGPPPSLNYGAPYAIQDYSQHLPSLMPSIDLSWPFALKLNAFTLAKILLKLVIFKMIVKFIALICLLLFIPKLEIVKKGDSHDDSDDDDGRRIFSRDSSLEKLNNLTAFVTNSIEKGNEIFGKSADDCTSFGCRLKSLIIHGETWNDYARLLKSYVAEETDKNDDNEKLSTNRVDT